MRITIGKTYQQNRINSFMLCRSGLVRWGTLTRRPTMKDKLRALAQSRAFWIVVGSALTAAGLNIPPAALEALPLLGPLVF